MHWEESPLATPVNLRLGDVMPLLSSATGRCFAAHLSKDATQDAKIAPMLQDELARIRRLPNPAVRGDLPTNVPEVQALLADVRRRGAARVIDTLLPGSGRVLRAGVRLGRPHGAGHRLAGFGGHL